MITTQLNKLQRRLLNLENKLEFIIKLELTKLIGLPIYDIGTNANITWFSFGYPKVLKSKYSGERVVGQFALHIQCEWEIFCNRTKLMSHNECLSEKDVYLFKERFRVSTFNQLIVQDVEVGCNGFFIMRFTEEYSLHVTPKVVSEYEEYWRLFEPGDLSSHFVVTSTGVVD